MNARARANRSDAHWSPVAELLETARGTVFPAYQCVVSARGGRLFESSGGTSGFPVDETSIFDLASLTKPLVTSPLAMHFAGTGEIDLDAPASDLLGFPLAGGPGVTIRRLLSHATGLPAWRPLFLEIPREGRADRRRARILEAACDTPPIAPPGTTALYSDLNFMILAAVLEKVGGMRIDALFRKVFRARGLGYRPLSRSATRPAPGIVPTEDDPTRGILAGRVNDENAYAMDGVAGHAGLFGTAAAVEAHARTLLDAWAGRSGSVSAESVRTFWRRAGAPRRSTWALGWDTPSPTGSSAGTRPPPRAVGHLGFTGGSVWIDPPAGAIVVLLTNRVWPDRMNDSIRTFRPRFHDAVWNALRRLPRRG